MIELLSEPEKASLVMQSLANYIIYFYPGILSIYLYNFFEAKTTNSTQGLVFKSFAISYIYNIVVRGIGLKINIVVLPLFANCLRYLRVQQAFLLSY